MKKSNLFVMILAAILIGASSCASARSVPTFTPTETPIAAKVFATDSPIPSAPSTPTASVPAVIIAQAASTESPFPTVPMQPSTTPAPSPTLRPSPTITRTPTPWPRPSGRITRIDTKFRSAAVNMDKRVLIYLPPGYNEQSTRRYPVLYMLHGYGGYNKSTTEWEEWGLRDRAEGMMQAGQLPPVIIVQPDGFTSTGQASYWFNFPPEFGGQRWGDYVWKDVVNYIDANYRTLNSRESRIIGGFSLGGQGALSLGFLHPEIFSVVGAHSPSFRGADGSIPFFGDWIWYNQFDPIWLAKNTDNGKQLTIWIDVGLNDDKVRQCGPGSDRCVEAFHDLLVAREVAHEYQTTWGGPHESIYWMTHISDYLQWYATKLVGQ